MAPSAYSTLPPAYWQPFGTRYWHLYIGPARPAATLARLALSYDQHADLWTWEVSITASGGDSSGYSYGHTRTWQRAERDALAALAALLHPTPTFLPTTFLLEKAL